MASNHVKHDHKIDRYCNEIPANARLPKDREESNLCGVMSGAHINSVCDQASTKAIQIADEQIASAPENVNARAARFVSDWLYANREHFVGKTHDAGLGMYDMAHDKVMIVLSALKDALACNGYSPHKTLRHLASQGIITKNVSSSGKTDYFIRRWRDGKTCSFVELDLARLREYIDRDNNCG